MVVTGPGERDVLLGEAFDSTDVQFSLGTTDRCSTQATYSWSLSDDYRVLSLNTQNDSCIDRATVLAGDWRRELPITRALVPERPYRAHLDPAIVFTPPAGFMFPATGSPPEVYLFDDGSFLLDAEDYAAFVTVGNVLNDRCDSRRGTQERITSFDDFLAWNRATTGATVSEPVQTAVGGHSAIRVDVVATDACPNAQLVTPDCFCMGPAWIGFENRSWAVDLGPKGFLVISFHDDNPPFVANTPERLAIAQKLVDSIQFP
jgi:hypothetical protein